MVRSIRRDPKAEDASAYAASPIRLARAWGNENAPPSVAGRLSQTRTSKPSEGSAASFLKLLSDANLSSRPSDASLADQGLVLRPSQPVTVVQPSRLQLASNMSKQSLQMMPTTSLPLSPPATESPSAQPESHHSSSIRPASSLLPVSPSPRARALPQASTPLSAAGKRMRSIHVTPPSSLLRSPARSVLYPSPNPRQRKSARSGGEGEAVGHAERQDEEDEWADIEVLRSGPSTPAFGLGVFGPEDTLVLGDDGDVSQEMYDGQQEGGQVLSNEDLEDDGHGVPNVTAVQQPTVVQSSLFKRSTEGPGRSQIVSIVPERRTSTRQSTPAAAASVVKAVKNSRRSSPSLDTKSSSRRSTGQIDSSARVKKKAANNTRKSAGPTVRARRSTPSIRSRTSTPVASESRGRHSSTPRPFISEKLSALPVLPDSPTDDPLLILGPVRDHDEDEDDSGPITHNSKMHVKNLRREALRNRLAKGTSMSPTRTMSSPGGLQSFSGPLITESDDEGMMDAMLKSSIAGSPPSSISKGLLPSQKLRETVPSNSPSPVPRSRETSCRASENVVDPEEMTWNFPDDGGAAFELDSLPGDPDSDSDQDDPGNDGDSTRSLSAPGSSAEKKNPDVSIFEATKDQDLSSTNSSDGRSGEPSDLSNDQGAISKDEQGSAEIKDSELAADLEVSALEQRTKDHDHSDEEPSDRESNDEKDESQASAKEDEESDEDVEDEVVLSSRRSTSVQSRESSAALPCTPGGRSDAHDQSQSARRSQTSTPFILLPARGHQTPLQQAQNSTSSARSFDIRSSTDMRSGNVMASTPNELSRSRGSKRTARMLSSDWERTSVPPPSPNDRPTSRVCYSPSVRQAELKAGQRSRSSNLAISQGRNSLARTLLVDQSTSNSSTFSILRERMHATDTPTPIIEISSRDPAAAARAVAILTKQARYIETGWLEEDEDGAESFGLTTGRIHRPEEDMSSRALPEYLHSAEDQLTGAIQRRRKVMGTPIRYTHALMPAATPYPPGAFPKSPTLNCHPSSSNDHRVPDPTRWGVPDWSALDSTLRECVVAEARSLLAAEKSLTKATAQRQAVLEMNWQTVVTRFLRKHEIDEEQCSGKWKRHNFAPRVRALQHKYLRQLENRYPGTVEKEELQSIAQADADSSVAGVAMQGMSTTLDSNWSMQLTPTRDASVTPVVSQATPTPHMPGRFSRHSFALPFLSLATPRLPGLHSTPHAASTPVRPPGRSKPGPSALSRTPLVASEADVTADSADESQFGITSASATTESKPQSVVVKYVQQLASFVPRLGLVSSSRDGDAQRQQEQPDADSGRDSPTESGQEDSMPEMQSINRMSVVPTPVPTTEQDAALDNEGEEVLNEPTDESVTGGDSNIEVVPTTSTTSLYSRGAEDEERAANRPSLVDTSMLRAALEDRARRKSQQGNTSSESAAHTAISRPRGSFDEASTSMSHSFQASGSSIGTGKVLQGGAPRGQGSSTVQQTVLAGISPESHRLAAKRAVDLAASRSARHWESPRRKKERENRSAMASRRSARANLGAGRDDSFEVSRSFWTGRENDESRDEA